MSTEGEICGFPTSQLKQLFSKFLQADDGNTFENGELKLNPKKLDTDFVINALCLEMYNARNLVNCLVKRGYLESEKLTPTPSGMSLANSPNLPRITLNKAVRMLDTFLADVALENKRPNARILVARVSLFGSVLEERPNVGDIDLLLELLYPEDLQPEDMDEEGELIGRLSSNPYISLHDEFDAIAVGAENNIVYEKDT
jgi:predicted nucleotidyltransferase